MKKIFYLSICIFSMALLSCNQENKTTDNEPNSHPNTETKDMWAEQIESNTSLIKPEGWAEEDWKAVNKNVDKQKIFNTIFNSVLNGEQRAYDFFTDSLITVEELKERIGDINASDISTIRTREKWNFNKERYTLEKQVTRIYLFTPKFDAEGEYLGDKALFYVKMND